MRPTCTLRCAYILFRVMSNVVNQQGSFRCLCRFENSFDDKTKKKQTNKSTFKTNIIFEIATVMIVVKHSVY